MKRFVIIKHYQLLLIFPLIQTFTVQGQSTVHIMCRILHVSSMFYCMHTALNNRAIILHRKTFQVFNHLRFKHFLYYFRLRHETWFSYMVFKFLAFQQNIPFQYLKMGVWYVAAVLIPHELGTHKDYPKWAVKVCGVGVISMCCGIQTLYYQ